MAGLALDGKIPDKYATSVSVNLKRGDDEFTVRGDVYNELKQVIEDSPNGANSTAAQNKLNELRKQATAIKEAKRKAQEEFDRLAKLQKDEEERKRTKVQPSSDDSDGSGPFGTGYTYDPKSVQETTDYVESGYQEASGGGEGENRPDSSRGGSGAGSAGEYNDRSGDFGGAGQYMQKGGLASKPKP